MSVQDRMSIISLMSAEERGVLFSLVGLAEVRRAPIPMDDAPWLARFCGVSTRKWNLIFPALVVAGAAEVVGGNLHFHRSFLPNDLRELFSRNTGETGEKRARNGRDIRAEKKTKANKINDPKPPLAGVVDNNLPLEISGKAVVVAKREREQNDWPDGGAQEHAEAICQAVNSPRLDRNKSHGLVTTAGVIAAWRNAGASWSDVLSVVASQAKAPGDRINGWKFFTASVERAIASHQAEVAEVVPFVRGQGPPSITDRMSDEQRRARALAFAELDRRNGRTN